jgi:hypothetical protein
MSVKIKILSAAVILVASVSVHAECAFPKAPAAIPNGATASEPEMVTAMQTFKTYNDEVAAFGKCLDDEIKEKAGSAQLMQLKTMQSKKHNAAVDELQAKAKEFNEQVRIFKSRNS